MGIPEMKVPVRQERCPALDIGVSPAGNVVVRSAGAAVEIEPGSLKELVDALTVCAAAGRQLARRKGGNRAVDHRTDPRGLR